MDRAGAEGWLVSFCHDGKLRTATFLDSVYGSEQLSREAAEAALAKAQINPSEIIALRKRFLARSDSRSGVPGLSRYDGSAERGPYWLGYYADPQTGKRKSKRFSILLYGDDLARKLALSWRKEGVAAEYQKFLELSGESPAVK